MNFIETLFGFSPDNNSGTTEAAIFLALVFAVIAAWYCRQRFKRSPE